MNDALQPAARSEAKRTWSSHCREGAKPYACLTFAAGKLSNVHIPSSAATGEASEHTPTASRTANETKRRIARELRFGVRSPSRGCRVVPAAYHPDPESKRDRDRRDDPDQMRVEV